MKVYNSAEIEILTLANDIIATSNISMGAAAQAGDEADVIGRNIWK